ncbi:hypothetical protein PspLS_03004 [Pyricularia sp. CBS 133598]|nr:hypothetical protein PspLS_03004 [Pyricularia sp. CBS 133598]
MRQSSKSEPGDLVGRAVSEVAVSPVVKTFLASLQESPRFQTLLENQDVRSSSGQVITSSSNILSPGGTDEIAISLSDIRHDEMRFTAPTS